MSGTSMDGIDAALLYTDGVEVIQELGNTSISYDPRFQILLKAAEYCVRLYAGQMDKATFHYPQALETYLKKELQRPELMEALTDYLYGAENLTLERVIQLSTQLHSQAVLKLLKHTGYQAKQIDVVGYHGQTLFHQPSHKISIIVGDGQALADQIGIMVVNDFRSHDISAGGQGAPLAPIYHYTLAKRDQKIPVAIVNCGGIANITLISSVLESDIIAFDTGPGNGLIDRIVRQRTTGKEHMDLHGKYGKQGKVEPNILKALYDKAIHKDCQNYFFLPPPKALDIGDLQLIEELEALSLADACRTLEAFTADTIINSVNVCPPRWILAGGGWNNPVIRHEFDTRLLQKFGKGIHILTADEAGWDSQAMEAQIFAYLAVRSLQNKPISFPGTTGVPEPLSGGKSYNPDKKYLT